MYWMLHLLMKCVTSCCNKPMDSAILLSATLQHSDAKMASAISSMGIEAVGGLPKGKGTFVLFP